MTKETWVTLWCHLLNSVITESLLSLLGGGNEKAQGGKLALMERVMPILSLKSISIKRFRTVLLFLYSLFLRQSYKSTWIELSLQFLVRSVSRISPQNADVGFFFFSVSMIATAKFSFIFAFINISPLRQAAKRSSFVN